MNSHACEEKLIITLLHVVNRTYSSTSSSSDCPAFQLRCVWKELVPPAQNVEEMVFTNEILNPGQRVTNEVRPDEAGSVRVEPGQLGVVKGEHTGRVEVPEEHNVHIKSLGILVIAIFCSIQCKT